LKINLEWDNTNLSEYDSVRAVNKQVKLEYLRAGQWKAFNENWSIHKPSDSSLKKGAHITQMESVKNIELIGLKHQNIEAIINPITSRQSQKDKTGNKEGKKMLLVGGNMVLSAPDELEDYPLI